MSEITKLENAAEAASTETIDAAKSAAEETLTVSKDLATKAINDAEHILINAESHPHIAAFFKHLRKLL